MLRLDNDDDDDLDTLLTTGEEQAMGAESPGRVDEAEGQATHQGRRGREVDDEETGAAETRPATDMGGSAELVTSIDDNKCRGWEFIGWVTALQGESAAWDPGYVKECGEKWAKVPSLYTQILMNKDGVRNCTSTEETEVIQMLLIGLGLSAEAAECNAKTKLRSAIRQLRLALVMVDPVFFANEGNADVGGALEKGEEIANIMSNGDEKNVHPAIRKMTELLNPTARPVAETGQQGPQNHQGETRAPGGSRTVGVTQASLEDESLKAIKRALPGAKIPNSANNYMDAWNGKCSPTVYFKLRVLLSLPNTHVCYARVPA